MSYCSKLPLFQITVISPLKMLPYCNTAFNLLIASLFAKLSLAEAQFIRHYYIALA